MNKKLAFGIAMLVVMVIRFTFTWAMDHAADPSLVTMNATLGYVGFGLLIWGWCDLRNAPR